MIPFDDFATSIYAMPGVEAECLALQDEYGLDVNLLLFCAYAAVVAQVELTEHDLAALEKSVAGVRNAAIEPLRCCRRAMKLALGALEGSDRDDTQNILARVKDLELAAEYVELQRLSAWLSSVLRQRPLNSDDLQINLRRLIQRRDTEQGGAPFPEKLWRAARTCFASKQSLPR
jgi:uncharacterized protein (TIGR02444 family)